MRARVWWFLIGWAVSGQGENLPDGACKVSFFLLESAKDSGWQCVRAPPSEFHDSYFNDVFTHFHTF